MKVCDIYCNKACENNGGTVKADATRAAPAHVTDQHQTNRKQGGGGEEEKNDEVSVPSFYRQRC